MPDTVSQTAVLVAKLRDLWQFVVAVAPAPIGALIGLRYAVEQTPKARALTWVCSCALGVFAGPWLGELMGFGDRGIAIVTLVAASVGMEIMAGLHVAAKSFAVDPVGIVSRLMGIFRRGPP